MSDAPYRGSVQEKSWHHSIYCAWRDGEPCNCKEKTKPRLLDLFCGAGGAARGYQQAGFYVIGVDHKPQPRYCGDEFIQQDALIFMRRFWRYDFDAIHASPPCQAFTDLKSMWNVGEHADLLTPTRELLEATGFPYVIENVEGAPMRSPTTLCGSSFGLRVRRHRLFETNWTLMSMPCAHGQQGVPVGVYGTGGGGQMTRGYKARGVEEAREVMETPWMTLAECSQAIPPAYTEFIGSQLMELLSKRTSCVSPKAPLLVRQ